MRIRLGIWLPAMIAAAILVGGWTSTFQAHQEGDEHAAHDKILRKGLIDAMKHGVALYNQEPKDVVGCVRVFEGALLSVKPLLHHHKDLQKKVEDGLTNAARMSFVNRAFALRALLDEITNKLGGKVTTKDKDKVDKKDEGDKKDKVEKKDKAAKDAPVKDKGKDTEKKDDPKDPPANTGALSGTVSYKGKNLSIGFVTLIDNDGRKFSANIQTNGKYAITRGKALGKYGVTPGVPFGEYKVVIEKSPSAPKEGQKVIEIPERYGAAATTPLTVTISREQKPFNIELED